MRTFAQKQNPTQQPKASQLTESAKSMKSGRVFSGPSYDVHSILHLQRTIGNQAVQRLIQENPKDSRSETSVPPIIQEVLSAAGASQPLDSTTRGFMESRFGHNFSRVRVFNNSKAAASADRMKAAAYTIDENMVFAKGWYKPNSNRGRRLIAHELTHVVQNRIKQNKTRFSPYPTIQNTQAEIEAERVSSRVQMGMKAEQIASSNAGIALTPVSRAIQPLLSRSATDWAVTVSEERDILSHLRGDSSLSTTIIDLNSAGMLDDLISRVDEPRYRRELLQLLGANLNSSARSLVEPLIIRLGSEWELQYNLGRLGVTAAAPAFSTSAFSHLISSTPTDPFTGVGATGVNPTTLSIGAIDQAYLAAGHAATVGRYSNPIPGSLPAYLATLAPAERIQQAQLMLQQPISSVEPGSFAGNLPSRAQVIDAAATAHNLHPEMLAAFLLAEQRDQSGNEDAADYLGARSRLAGRATSIGLGQVLTSTARREDLFADLLSSRTRSGLGRREIARLLASDEFNIFAAARYIRRVADNGSTISIATLPNTQSAFPGIDMAAYADNSATWPDDNIRALASEYTSRAWDDRLSIGWADFVFEAYRDVNSSGVFP